MIFCAYLLEKLVNFVLDVEKYIFDNFERALNKMK